MTRLLQKFFPFLRKKAEPVFISPSPVWTSTDKENLGRFLRGDTGRKLIQRLRATEAANAIASVKDVFHTQHSAGQAQGYGDAIEHLISLSRSCRVEQEKAIGAPGAAPADENPAQAEAREMAELLARMSP